MITIQEQTFIKKFVVKDKQDRYLTLPEKGKIRKMFIEMLYHFNDFNWQLFREIPGNESKKNTIANKVKSRKNLSTCFIISTDSDYDGKTILVDGAIENVVGIEGSILIFGDAEITYYEGEAPGRRYIRQFSDYSPFTS
jgi:hypothetical protein